jgi:dipeptidyl-peptidase-4
MPRSFRPVRRTYLIGLAGLLSLFALRATPLEGQAPRLTLERLTSYPTLSGTAPEGPAWSPDSSRLAFRWNDRGMPFLDVWIADLTSASPRRVADMANAFPYPEARAAGDSEALASRVSARARGGVSDAIWTPDGNALVFAYRGSVFRIGADGGGLTRLTDDAGGAGELRFSPDGRHLSFIREGDLWLRREDTGDVVRATRVGVPTIGTVPGGRYFRPDVELTRSTWSPDSRFVALHFEDRRNVRKVPFPHYLGPETSINWLRRDYPGDNDGVRAVALYFVDRGHLQTLELPDRSHRRISSFSWSPDGTQLLVDQYSEDTIDRWISVVDVPGGSTREIWHDSRQTRDTQFWASEWQAHGKGIVFVSDMSGRHHLYALALGSRTPVPLTAGEFSVVSSRGPTTLTAVRGRKELFFVSTQKSPYERHVYRMAETGGAVTQVTSSPGVHAPTVSPDGSRLAVISSNDVTPPDLYVVESRGGPERRVTKSPLPEFYTYKWLQPRYVTFKSRVDDFTIHARVLEPANLDRHKRHPAILGSVYSNTVRNQWGGKNHLLQQYLAMEGEYIGMHVDVRGSTGYGRAFREAFLTDVGGRDIEDLHSGVEYLKSLGYVDPSRIGIWGNSYGGTLTVASLFKKPGVYKAGVAGAPAISAAHFTTGDVQRVRRPATHPDTFRTNSALTYAEGLKDHLLIIHGLQDDVVPFKTSVMLAEKLMLLGKDFDFVLVPAANHGWSQQEHYGQFTFKKLVEHFDRYLGRGGRAAADPTSRFHEALLRPSVCDPGYALVGRPAGTRPGEARLE